MQHASINARRYSLLKACTEPQLWQLLLFTLCAVVYIKNYWLAEDAYINFRSLDQLWAGRGPVWNPGERVQVYTSALWYWLVAAGRLFIHNLYWDTFACGLMLYLLMIYKVLRVQPGSLLMTIALVLLLLTSNSFMDFSASGLENVLIYFLITFFFFWYICQPETPSLSVTPYLWASLFLLARHDNLMLLLPFLALLTEHHVRTYGFSRTLRTATLGLMPFLLWTAFSVIYYGFPFPNTAYAKLCTGIPESELVIQGLNYVRITTAYYDHLLPLVIIAGIGVGLSQTRLRPLAYGLLLSVLYVIYVGGDYMRGRFFSDLYLLAALLLIQGISTKSARVKMVTATAIIASCIFWNFKAPFTPITTDLRFIDHVKIDETSNERGIFYRSTSIPAIAVSNAMLRPFPDWPFYTDGLELAKSGKPWVYITNIGMTGYAAGLNLHIFDRLALADPLMARLPAIPGPWAPGHFVRDMPWGYAEANLDGASHIYDADLDDYYRTLRIITRSPRLFTVARYKAIARANLSPSFGKLRTSHIERWSQRGCKICKGENIPPGQK